jgi:hypothetical protein
MTLSLTQTNNVLLLHSCCMIIVVDMFKNHQILTINTEDDNHLFMGPLNKTYKYIFLIKLNKGFHVCVPMHHLILTTVLYKGSNANDYNNKLYH